MFAHSSRERIEPALTAAVRFLLERQARDGAWRSEMYAAFKEGDALTPLVLNALFAVAPAAEVRRGAAFLAGMVRPDGGIAEGPHGLNYPAYTAALTVSALSRAGPEFAGARDAWLTYLLDRQLTEALGWSPEDQAYGGWGYAHRLPRKPAPGVIVPLLTESNLSATVLAVEALRDVGRADTSATDRALRFIRRCQNYADDGDPAFDDGGFFFMYDDPLRNKAGVAGTDRTGRQRFTSYGSMTADGLRALRACGLPTSDPRVTAARLWLERNFSVTAHPGRFAPGRRAVRASIYYYYCWSLALALAAAGPAESGAPPWADALAGELLRRQQPDGCWVNHEVDVREDDPVVATSQALSALTVCRGFLLDRASCSG
jgi:hypothetical protein